MSLGPGDRHALARELAARGGVEITCAGRSMEPTVHPGDRLRVVAATRPRIGEVVLIETADGCDLVLHRVVAALPLVPWFLHTGDAPSPEGPAVAHRRQLIGRALLPRRLPRVGDATGALARATAALRRRL